MPSFTFETVTGRHILQLAAIEGREFPGYPLNYCDLLALLRKGTQGWIVKLAGEIVAYALVSVAGERAHLLKLWVLTGYRGQGIGKRLLEKTTRFVRERGAKELVLEVAESNLAAIGFYNALGFQQSGIHPAFYPGTTVRENALVLSMKIDNA